MISHFGWWTDNRRADIAATAQQHRYPDLSQPGSDWSARTELVTPPDCITSDFITSRMVGDKWRVEFSLAWDNRIGPPMMPGMESSGYFYGQDYSTWDYAAPCHLLLWALAYYTYPDSPSSVFFGTNSGTTVSALQPNCYFVTESRSGPDAMMPPAIGNFGFPFLYGDSRYDRFLRITASDGITIQHGMPNPITSEAVTPVTLSQGGGSGYIYMEIIPAQGFENTSILAASLYRPDMSSDGLNTSSADILIKNGPISGAKVGSL